MTPTLTLNFNELLAPLSEDAPAGRYLKYTPAYHRLNELRKAELGPRLDPSGNPAPPSLAGWKVIAELATQLLTHETRDLEIAVVLAEALTRIHGFAGLRDGLRLVRELHDRFWETLHPGIEDGDLGARVGALCILEHPRFTPLLLNLPLTAADEGQGPYSWYQWKQGRERTQNSGSNAGTGGSTGGGTSGGTSGGASAGSGTGANDAIAWPTAKQFDEVADRTPAEFYRDLGALLDSCCEELEQLCVLIEARYSADGIALSGLRKALEDCRSLVDRRRPPPEPIIDVEAEPAPEEDPGPAAAREAPQAASNRDSDEGDHPVPGATTHEMQPVVITGITSVAPLLTSPLPDATAPAPGQVAGGGASEAQQPSLGSTLEPELRTSLNSGPSDTQMTRRLEFPAIADAHPATPEWDHGLEPRTLPDTLTLEDIPSLVAHLAQRIRARDDRDPLSYLLLRALRRSELRAASAETRETLFAPPTSEQRHTLRSLYLAQQWQPLLEAAERVLAGPAGRAWLDLQYYTHTALFHLGPAYAPLADLVARETRRLLEELEELPLAELTDGTPAANHQTRMWLRERLDVAIESTLTRKGTPTTGGTSYPRMVGLAIAGTPSPAAGSTVGAEAGNGPVSAARTSSGLVSATEDDGRSAAWTQAIAAFSAGRLPDALASLQEARDAARCGRDRFLRQLELAELCLLAGQLELARPLLQALAETDSQRRLIEWEDPRICARLENALIQAGDAFSGQNSDDSRRHLFQRLCQSDITRALAHLQLKETSHGR